MEFQLTGTTSARVAELERVVSFLSKTEGRDKVTKILQYACRALSWVSFPSKTTANNFAAVYRMSADSRKIFRLGKFLTELSALVRLAAAKAPESDLGRRIQILQALCRASLFCYWLVDNAFILSKLKVFRYDQQKLARLSGLFWLLALLAGAYCELLRLREVAIAAKLLDGRERDTDATKETTAARMQLQQTRRTATLNLIKQCCDMVAAANMLGIPFLLLRRHFNDGFVGVTGTVSAAIACSQIY